MRKIAAPTRLKTGGCVMSRQRWMVLVAWLVLAVTAGEATARTIYVKAYGSGSRNGQSWADAYDLQPALAAAQPGDQIWVASGYYMPTTGSDRNARIRLAPGVPVYGGFAGHEISVWMRNWTANETILSGDIGRRGDPADNSYCIVTGAPGAELDGFIIRSGRGKGQGAGMEHTLGPIVVANCTFVDNAGAAGGGLYVGNSTAAVVNCRFIQNSGADGGGFRGSGGSITLTDCQFTSNSAVSGAGAYLSNTTLRASGCRFSGNSTLMGGGGLYCGGVTMESVTGCSFERNKAGRAGGGCSISGGRISELRDCIFLANQSGELGAGMTCDSATVSLMEDCTFEGHTRVALAISGGHLTMKECSFRRNTGGGFYANEGTFTVDGCIFLENKSYYGAGVYMFKGSATISNCVFEANEGSYGGGIRNAEGVASIIACDIKLNKASLSGGGIEESGRGKTNIAHCTFTQNVAGHSGGAIYTRSGEPKIEYCTFKWNSARDGGGIYNYSAKSIILGCAFIQNSALVGGGIFDYAGGPIVTGCAFDSNVAISAAGMYTGRSTVTKCEFFGNAAETRGGAMFLFDSPQISQCNFTNNSAATGGAIQVENGKAESLVTGCTIRGNRAQSGGGIEFISGETTFRDCVIIDNRAFEPGSMRGGGVRIVNGNSFPRLINCSIVGNRAGADGGGICNDGGYPIVESCVISGNVAESAGVNSRGGGIFNSIGWPTITNCTIFGNRARTNGGGMFDAGSGSFPLLTNCILWGNEAEADKQYARAGGMTVFTHCDIAGSGGSGERWNSGLGVDGGGNQAADPLFVNPSVPAGADGAWGSGDEGLRLRPESPCIGAALAGAAPAEDLLGLNRIGAPEIGAYEFVERHSGAGWWWLYR